MNARVNLSHKCALTRYDFEQLPLRWVCVPTLDGPVFVFNDWKQGDANCLQRRLRELSVPYVKGTREKRVMLAPEMRRVWRQLVELADGYTWPGAQLYGGQIVYEFAPE